MQVLRPGSRTGPMEARRGRGIAGFLAWIHRACLALQRPVMVEGAQLPLPDSTGPVHTWPSQAPNPQGGNPCRG